MDTKEREELKLEIEKIKLERLKVFSNIITVLITVAIGTFGVAYMNNVFQSRQLEQQKLINQAEIQLQEKKAEAEIQLEKEKAEADRRQAEMKYLGDFLNYALEDDIDRRIRFAEYFAALTISPDLKEKWNIYCQDLKSSLTEAQKHQQELLVAQQEGNSEKIKNIEKAIVDLQTRLEPLPQKMSIDIKRILDCMQKKGDCSGCDLNQDGRVDVLDIHIVINQS